MSEKRSELYFEEWKSRISAAEVERDKGKAEWKRFINYYKNKMWSKVDEKIKDEYATVNLIYPLVSIVMESTYNRNPKIFLKPTRPEFVLGAEVLQFLINHIWYDLKINKEIRRCIKRAVLMGASPAELGFSGKFESGVVKPNDMPYVRSQMLEDFICDSTCKTFDDEQSLFRGFKRKVTYSQFKEMYPKEAKKLGPKVKEKVEQLGGTDKLWPDGIPPWTRVEYWVIQDLHSNKFFVIHMDLEDFVDIVDNPYNAEGFLSEVLAFNEIPGELWPMPDIRPVEFQQRELNEMRTFMKRHWRKLIDAYLYDQNLLSETTLNKLVNAEDVEFIGVDGMPPDGALKLIDKGNVSSDFYQHMSAIMDDYRNISPINEYYSGGKVPGTKTAYETRQIMETGSIRLQGHSRFVTEFVEAIARKLVQILKDYYTLPIVSQIAGPRGEMYWHKFSRFDIQAEVDVRVHLGSTMPVDEQGDKMRAREFYQMYRQDPLLDQRKVVVRAMEMEGMPDAEGMLLGGPAEPFTPNDRGGGANEGANMMQGLLRGYGRGT